MCCFAGGDRLNEFQYTQTYMYIETCQNASLRRYCPDQVMRVEKLSAKSSPSKRYNIKLIVIILPRFYNGVKYFF